MGSPPTPAPGQPPAPDAPQGLAAESEHRLTGNRAIRYLTDRVQPPSALYITGDDSLIVTAANSVAGQSLTIVAQELLPDGRVQPNQWTMTVPATRAAVTQLFPLAEGFLLNVSVTPTVVPTRRGQTWVSVGIRRGSLQGGVTLQQIIQDYVDTFTGAAWPYSTLHNSLEGRGYTQALVLGPGTPGAGFIVTVPAGANWQVNTLRAYFITTAAVATRQVQLNVDDGSNVFYQDMVEPTIAASSGLTVVWARLLGTGQTTSINGSNTRSFPDLRLLPGWRINLGLWSEQAGDVWNIVNLEVEEWLAV